MRLKCLASGSSGNCYLLKTDTETLILDAGIPIKAIKRGLDWNIKNVVGVVVSHGHLDHSRSVKDFEEMGIDVYKPYDETVASPLKRKFGNFSVQAFKLPHNGTPNYGYYIRAEGQSLLYMTDFEYCAYNFLKQKVNHILIECNYITGLVDRDLPQYEHKIRGHCSLNYCKKFIKDNKTNALRTVILLHMGDETCDPIEAVTEVRKIAPMAHVDYADRGKEWELSELSF